MPWAPSATVTIAGSDVTAAVLEGATLFRGRSETYAQASAGYATVSLLTTVGAALQPAIGATLTVDLDDSAGSPVRLFTGTVQQYASTTASRGDSAVVETTVTAVGPLSTAFRRTTDAARAAELDGARIAWALTEALATTWEGWTPATGTWADVDASTTWAALPPDLGEVDSGVYSIAAFSSGTSRSAYAIAAEASGSGQGVIYETAGGAVGWANADRRATLIATGVELDQDEVAATVRSSSSAADLMNVIALAYDGGTVNAEDAGSIAVYGRYAGDVTTTLEDASAASDVATLYLERHAYPTDALYEIELGLETGSVPDAVVDELLDVNTNTAVILTDLPSGFGATTRTVFVEGVRWTLGRRTSLLLTVSPAFLSIGDVRWSGVTPTLAWSAVPSTLAWQDARSL